MAFELVVAAKRDPAERAEAVERARVPASPSLPVATIDVSGIFSEQSANDLARTIENVLHKPADTVIVRFQEIACDDLQLIANFARWVQKLRRDGHDVRVAVGEPYVHALLADEAMSADAVISPAEVDAVAGRSVIDVHR